MVSLCGTPTRELVPVIVALICRNIGFVNYLHEMNIKYANEEDPANQYRSERFFFFFFLFLSFSRVVAYV